MLHVPTFELSFIHALWLFPVFFLSSVGIGVGLFYNLSFGPTPSGYALFVAGLLGLMVSLGSLPDLTVSIPNQSITRCP